MSSSEPEPSEISSSISPSRSKSDNSSNSGKSDKSSQSEESVEKTESKRPSAVTYKTDELKTGGLGLTRKKKMMKKLHSY